MRLTAFLLSLSLIAACSPSKIALRTTARLVADGRPSLHEESDPEVAKAAIPAQLKLLEGLLVSAPANPDLLAALVEGWTGYSFLFVEDEDPARGAAFYRRAAGYGLRLLARREEWRGLDAKSPDDLDVLLREAEPRDVPALYWTATAWAGWANLDKADPAALAAVPKAARFMERVLALDPAFEHGGADLFFGVYYASRPRIAGGDPTKAREHFEKVLARTGRRYLPAQYLMMRSYAAGELDEELFKRLGAEAAAADPAALPDARLANEIAKRKAKALLEKKDEIF
ncbi:hypothetical protein EPO15_02465 [bacterium]|nr:MAG: hypothetical protein EPO15_02465 [bacterium]